MVSNWVNTTAMRAILLVAGTALLTWGIVQRQYLLAGIGLVALLFTIINYRQGVKKLEESGIRTSVDDFGSGYSSMCMIRDIPFL